MSILQFIINNMHNSIEIQLLQEGKVIGHGVLSIVIDEAEILDIAIVESQQGLGFGRLLLQHMMQFVEQQGVKKIFLEVRVSNQAAIKLYESQGFEQISIRKNYYPLNTEREDALIFRKQITSSP